MRTSNIGILALSVLLLGGISEAMGRKKYYVPVGKTEQGEVTYKLATRDSQGMYWAVDDTLYTIGPNPGLSSDQAGWTIAGTAIHDLNKGIQQNTQQEQMLNRVLDRQRALDATTGR